LLLQACQPVKDSQEVPEEKPNPEAAAVQAKLFAAAESGDVRAFEALLSQKSVLLFEQHFEVMAALERPKGEPAYGWEQLLQLFAKLPPTARTKTPFTVIQEDGKAKLALSAHPDALFFHQVARSRQ
jgi:hypothetical protein